jgi:branched-chain amino acid transport system substrate-binding protein
MVRIYCLGLVAAIGVALAAPPEALAADKTIVVGQAIDLSGPNGSIGRDYVAGITTYFDSVNVKGGVNGRKIVYIVRDDGGDAAESARQVTGLIRQERSQYLLGAIGAEATRAIVSAPAFVESRHQLFAPLADSAATPRARVLFWRPGIESEYRFLLDYFDKLGIKQVGLAYQESPQTRAAYQFVVAEIKRRGMTLTGTARIGAGQDLAAESRRLGTSGARLVLAVADTIGTAQFLRAFRKVDPATFVAGTSLTNLATLAEIAGGSATEFTVFSQVVPNPASNASALQTEHAAMMKKFRDEPVSSVTLEGFAVAKTLVRAMQLDAASSGSLQALAAPGARIDLGGLTVQAADQANNMSRFVEIALFRRGGLLF